MDERTVRYTAIIRCVISTELKPKLNQKDSQLKTLLVSSLMLSLVVTGCVTRSGVIVVLPEDRAMYDTSLRDLVAPDDGVTVQLIGRRADGSKLLVDIVAISKSDEKAKAVASMIMNVGLRSPGDLIRTCTDSCPVHAIRTSQGVSWHAQRPVAREHPAGNVYLCTVPLLLTDARCTSVQLDLIGTSWDSIGAAAGTAIQLHSSAER